MMKRKKNLLFPFAMTLPTLLILIGLSVFPLLFILYYGLTDYYLLSKSSPQFILFENYVKLFNDPYFRQAVVNTLRFSFLAVLTEVLSGLMLACLASSLGKGTKALRTLLLLPALLPGVTAALTWQMMLSNHNGIINKGLAVLGQGPVNWLMDPKIAFYAILVIDIWQYAPFVFLLVYAAMQTVPQSQYEAARIDGAGWLQSFYRVTLPNIRGTLALTVMLRLIDSFRLFDKVNILTKGGPANTTATITQYIYQNGIRSLKVGYGAAASVIMTLIILVPSAFYIAKSLKGSFKKGRHP